MTQRKRFQSIGLLVTVVLSAVLLWALAAVVWPVPAVYADDLPDAVDDTATTDEDTPVDVGVLNNDLGYTLTVDTVGTPGNGVASANGITVTYTPTLNFNGLDVFTYTIRDAVSLTDTATITVTVTPINDPPVVGDIPNQTIAEGGTFTTINLDDYVNDVDNSDTEITWTYSGNSELSVSITNRVATIGVPGPDWNGSETIVFTATDPGPSSDGDSATFTVTPVNDPPVANDDVYTVTEGVTLTVTVSAGVLDNDTDVENDTLTATLASGPSHGALTLNPDGSFTYVHDGTTSSDSFTYQAYDGAASSNVATVTINIQLFPPVITAITVTSNSPTYSYDPGLAVTGGQVFFNSRSGEGGGQTVTVTVSWTDANPYSLRGDGAFNDNPPADTSGPPWTVSYSIENNAPSQANRVFTVTDKAGLTDTAVIAFTRDNDDPTVVITDVTNPGYDYDTDELDADGSNWYNAGDFIGNRWFFTSTTSDIGAAGLASGSAFWDHSNGITYDQTKDCGSDGSDFFSGVITNTDGIVTATVTITDRVGNSANDLVVFNIDNTPPAIRSPSIDEYSPYLYVSHPGSTVIYYGDGMGSIPQPFDVKGQARDDGVGLDRATYPSAFGGTPDPTDLKGLGPGWHSWFGTYNVRDIDYGNGSIQVSVSDLLGNSATWPFAYYRDAAHPEVEITDVTDPDYDDGNELNGIGNWYRPSGLSDWSFTSTTLDNGPAGLASGTAFWNHSNGTARDQVTDCGSDGDGTFTGVNDDGSGTVTVTVTITDNVANATTSVPLVIRLDETPPSVPGSFAYQNDTDSGSDGFPPEAGYYDNTVIQLQWITSTDSLSGLPTNPYHLGTAPHPTGGSYAINSPYTVGSSGTYSIYLTAEDNVGNVSGDAVTGPVVVDTQPPQGSVVCPASTGTLSFTVSWSAADQGPAGLRSTNPYSVSYNVDDGVWQNWLANTSATAATFGPDSPTTVAYGHTYCFRMRAVDNAGNVTYTAGNNCTRTIDPAANLKKVFLPLIMANPNWGFETGDFTSWQHGGQLAQSVSTADRHSGSYSALLGSPSYNCSGGVPVGSAWLRRSVAVPSSGSPTLSFWYRIRTQDKNSTLSDQYDLFAAYINGSQLVVKDANTTQQEGCGTTHDLGWKQVIFSLNAYKGQTIEITFYNYNRPDGWYNTYTYVDDVSVQ